MEIQLKTSLKTINVSTSKAKSRAPILGILEISNSMIFMNPNKTLDFYPTFASLLSELFQFKLWFQHLRKKNQPEFDYL